MSFRKYGSRTMKSYPKKAGYKRPRKSYGSKSSMYSKYKSRAMRPSGALSYAKGKELKLLEVSSSYGGPDSDAGPLTPGTVPEYRVINAVPVGSGVSSRVGRRIELQSLRVRISIGNNPTFDNTVNAGGIFRFLVVYDRQPNGALPGITDLISTQTFAPAGAMTNNLTNVFDPFGNVNVNYRDRFKILMDESVNLPAVSVGAVTDVGITNFELVGGKGNVLDRYLKLKGLITMFGADNTPENTNISDIKSGALYLVSFAGYNRPQAVALDNIDKFAYVAGFHLRLIYSDA